MSNKAYHNLPYVPEWLANKLDYWIKKKTRPAGNSYATKRQNIYILPSKSGWLYIITLLAILSGAINYNNSLAYLLCFFLASLGFIAMLQTHQNISNIIIRAGHSPSVFCGSAANFVFQIQSQTQRCHIALETTVNNNIFSIKARESSRFIITENSVQRGKQCASRFKLYTEYPLGLYHAWTQVQIDNTAIIYPKPIIEETPQQDFFDGEGNQNQLNGEDEFSGIRDYKNGDKLRSMAWKTIAKTNKLYTKEFHSEAGDLQIFDYDKLSNINSIETRLSILCGLILKASQMNRDYGLKLPGKTIPPGSGEQHKHQCLTALALIKL